MNVQGAEFSRSKSVKGPVSDTIADESQGGEADRCGHPPDLTIPALGQRNGQPTGGNGFTVTHGGMSWPDIRRSYRLDSGGTRHTVFERHTLPKLLQCCSRRGALYLDPIGLGHFLSWRCDEILQLPVIGEQEQAFRVIIQAPCRINPWYGYPVGQCGPAITLPITGLVSKLAHNPKRFVE